MFIRAICPRVAAVAVATALMMTSLGAFPALAADPTAGIEGTVMTSAGAPLAGIEIRAYPREAIRSNPNAAAMMVAVTGADGAYALTLPAEGYFVVAYVDTSGVYRDTAFPLSGKPLEYAGAVMASLGATQTLSAVPMYTAAEVVSERTYRVSGADRYQTAAAISRQDFPNGADTVVLASGTVFADALAASPLAGLYGAPILITPSAGLPAPIKSEIKRLDPTSVIIIGSGAAVSTAVESQLQLLGLTDLQSVSRIQGRNRYETAEQVVYAMGALLGPREMPIALVCRGDGFADALSVSPHAYYWGCPIILTEPTRLNPAAYRAVQYLGQNHKLTLWPDQNYQHTEYATIGGRAAIAGSVHNAVADAIFDGSDLWSYTLCGGDEGHPGLPQFAADRYGTCAAVNDFFSHFAGPFDRVGVASGANFPDALAGGAALGVSGGALVLTPPTRLHVNSAYTLAENGPFVMYAQVFGATSAVGATPMASASAAMGTHLYDIDASSHVITASYVDILSATTRRPDTTRGARSRRRELPKPDITIAHPGATPYK